MKYQTKRLSICIALVLLCAVVLPLFGGCAKDEKKEPAKNEVVDKVPEKDKTEDKKPDQSVPAVTESDPNAPSLQSTPNKGGTQQLTSGGQGTKSAYTTYLEEQAKITAEMIQADKEKVKAARRDLAETTFRTMLTLPWTPAQTFEYTIDGTTYVMNKGTVYYGLPYAHGAQSLMSHMLFWDPNPEDGGVEGAMTMNFTGAYFTGGSATSRLGFNREDSLIQAWHMVSESTFAGTTNDMVPENGYLLVGDLKLPRLTIVQNNNDPALQFGGGGGATQYGPDGVDILSDGSLSGDTDEICKENGEQGMYKAYALLQKADGLVKNATGTDAMMVVSVSVVKNADGTINGDASKVTYMKQTAAFSNQETIATNKYNTLSGTFAAVDKEITFKELYNESFIPMTVKEFGDGSPMTAVKLVRDSLGDRQKQANIYAGTLTATRRIAYLTHVVVDSTGKTVSSGIHLATQTDLRYSATEKRFSFNVQKITSAEESGRFIFDKDVGSHLATKSSIYIKGVKYRNIVTLTTVTGDVIVARDYTFVA